VRLAAREWGGSAWFGHRRRWHYLRSARTNSPPRPRLLCVQNQEHRSPSPRSLRDQRVLPQGLRGDGAGVRPRGPRRIASTLEIAERCNRRSSNSTAKLIPRLPGARRRGPRRATCGGAVRRALRERLRRPAAGGRRWNAGETELEVDRPEWAFNAYFLIVWDFSSTTRSATGNRRGGPGRGSAAGFRSSAYTLRITDVDPLAYDLLFRALPEPRARVDARHRHRFLGPRPRRVLPLRGSRSTAASRSRRSSRSARWRRRQANARRRPRARPTTNGRRRPASRS